MTGAIGESGNVARWKRLFDHGCDFGSFMRDGRAVRSGPGMINIPSRSRKGPMTHRTPSLLLAAIVAIGCARTPDDSTDSSAAAEHDPSMHEAHVGRAADTSTATDSSFAALQARGALGMGMGVDQYTSTHTFEPRPDGGRITLRRDVDDDTAGVEQIRAHLGTIARAFAAGDFETPAFVHAGTVPGTDVMAARRALIRYRTAPITRGAELVITTADSAAIDAIHRFLAFQRREHRAGEGSDTTRTPPR